MKLQHTFLPVVLGVMLMHNASAQCLVGNATPTNVIYKVNGVTKSNLSGSNTTPGSEVEVIFTIPSGKQPTRLSLVSYRAPESSFNREKAHLQEVYDQQSGIFAPGTHSMKINIPTCYFQVDFVKGCVIERLGPDSTNPGNFYGSRVISAGGGGVVACDPDNDAGNANATNVIYKVNGKVKSGLNGNTNPGDEVEVTFTVPEGKTPTRFSLVSYTAPSSFFSESNADQQEIYDRESDVFPPGTHTMHVMVPECYYQVDFVKGGIIEKLGPANSKNFYGKQNRLISFDNGGNKKCNDKKITICHVPPGNPDNAHTITISVNALPAHLAHGDYIGECKEDTGEVIPVKLTHFSGTKISENEVELRWKTASEMNNAYIAIEKSGDINTWEEVCRVPGAPGGNSITEREYSCTDKQANSGGNSLVYYRPRQADFNGATEYHNMISVRIKDSESATIVDPAYPNPIEGNRIHIPFNAQDNSLISLRLLTLDGRVMVLNTVAATRGQQIVEMDLADQTLVPGLYILEIVSGEQKFTQKLYKR